jgi:hypothetical protein
MMAGQPGMAERVPTGPVEAPPAGFVPEAGQTEILAAMLAGIELGARDRDGVEHAQRINGPLTEHHPCLSPWTLGFGPGVAVAVAVASERLGS